MKNSKISNNEEFPQLFFLTKIQIPTSFIILTQVIYVLILKIFSILLRKKIAFVDIHNFKRAQAYDKVCKAFEDVLTARKHKEYLREIQEYENIKELIKPEQITEEKSQTESVIKRKL